MCKKTFHTITKQEYQAFFCNNKRFSKNPIQDNPEKQKSFALFASTTIENKPEISDLTPLKVALDIRKFEIDLYWKRTTFFWAFLVSIYTAYFFICLNHKDSLYLILLSFLASCFSLLWYLSNRGSKFWQENWEAHVSALENGEIGPLFKTIKKNKKKFWNPFSAYDFSVSKANIIASILICLVSIGLFFKNVIFICTKLTHQDLLNILQNNLGVIILSLAFFIILIAIGFFAKGFASKAEPENPDDSEFIMGSDSYKNLKESK